MLLVETILALLAVVLAFAWPTLGDSWFERIEARLGALARRRSLAVLVIGVTTLALRIAVLPVEPIPNPSVHDEFSYLLQADTFAHGRLTNPTPAMWVHFETFHEIFQPTYCSKFFPGQGLFLALGQVVFGHPFWGVWLTSGLMCAAITWMLQGWFSAEWAFLGGALAMLRFGVFGYWANSYWGGNVAAIGGALVLGALPRIKSSVRWQDATLMGIGLALLANSRPWEGLVLSLPVAVMLFWWIFGKNRPPLKVSLRAVVLPLGIVLCLTGGWLAYYCWRTTGSPVTTPYQVYEQTYGAYPYMVWQHVRAEPFYHNPIMRKLNIDQVGAEYHTSRVFHLAGNCLAAGLFFGGPLLLVTFGMLPFVLPFGFSFRDISPRVQTVLVILFVFAIGSELVIFYNPHYSAPVVGFVIALALGAIRRIRHWNTSGLFFARAISLAYIVVFGTRVLASPLHLSPSRYSAYYFDQFFDQRQRGWFSRAKVQFEMGKREGKQLVIVQYWPDHDVGSEWVYNEANIDQSRVIWARDMGAVKNQELIEYYKGRKVWALQADDDPPKLAPYPSTPLQDAAK